jgi:long-chain fatty acid transport protein
VKIFFVRVSAVVSLLFLICSIVLSAGFQLNEHGAKAVGMGGAFVAQASDPSAIYFNPAGLAFQQGVNFYGGGTFIIPTHTYHNPTTGQETSTDYQLFFTPNVYGTYAVNKDLVVGLGVFTPYGLGTRWPSGWDGKYEALNSQLATFYINPTIAYKISDKFSIGIGVSYIYGTLDMSRNFAKPMTGYTITGLVSMSGTAHAWGFNAGILYKPIEKLSIGASVRTLSRLEFSGDAKYSDIAPSAAAAFISNGTGSVTIPLPANIYLGAAYELTHSLTVEADLQFVGWSVYDALSMSLPTGVVVSEQNWDDTYIGRIGAEYKLNSAWTLRGGLAYDMTPQPKSTMMPMMPDADRIDISVGGGYRMNEHIYVDAAYMLGLCVTRTSTLSDLPGEYNSTFSAISINVGYFF